MLKRFLLSVLLFLAFSTVVDATTYYLSQSGNDSSSGLSIPAAWLTPNHSLNCGDIILAQPGTTYNFSSGQWGTVTCAGNNNVVWLECATFDTCKGSQIFIDKSYWGIQGFEIHNVSYGSCFLTASNNSSVVHHVIFANNIANGCFNTGFGSTSGAGGSNDYVVMVGNVSYDAGHSTTVCGQNYSVFGPKNSDSASGTHIFIAWNIGYDTVDNATCNSGSPSDGEGFEADTWNLNSYTYQGVIEYNLFFLNGGRGINTLLTPGALYLKYNTLYGNSTDVNQGACAEILFNNATGTTTVDHNLVVAAGSASHCTGSTKWDFQATNGTTSAVTLTNYTYSYSATGNCTSSGGFSCPSFPNTNPNLSSPTDPGAPSCGSYANVTACMVGMGVVANFAPTVGGASTYGYQAPSATPVTDALYPAWLCTVSMPANTVTSGCGGGGSSPTISGLSTLSGQVGTSVTITGTNYGASQGGSTVTVNGTSATASSWSDTSIVVTIPAGATTGPIVVTVSSVASNGVTFTVTTVGPPLVIGPGAVILSGVTIK